MMAALALSFAVTPYFVLIGILPLLFMEALHVSIHQYAFYQGSIVALYALLSLSMPYVLTRFDRVRVVSLSTIIATGGLVFAFLMSMIIPDHPLIITCLVWVYVIGIVVPPTMMYVQAMDMFPTLRASASALIHALRMLSMALGTALAGVLYDGSFRPVSVVMLSFMALSLPMIYLVMRKSSRSTTMDGAVSAMH
jgi:DHA1 family bicyclomycin/chloramphenicol resistance-like MFS transporter